jgi:hypothetical protein
MGLEDVRPVAKKKSVKETAEAVIKKAKKKKLRIVEDDEPEPEPESKKKKKTRRPPFKEGVDDEGPSLWDTLMKASQEGMERRGGGFFYRL